MAQHPDDAAVPFDLTGANQVSNRSYPTLSILEDRTATRFAQELAHALHAMVEVVPESSEVVKFHVFASRLAEGSCLNQLQLEGLGGNGLLTIESDLLFVMLERLLGGGGVPGAAPPPPRARLSSIEQRVVRRIVHLFGRSMEEAWRAQLPVTVKHLRIESRPENVPIVPGNESVTATTFKIAIDEHVARIQLALPLSVLELHRKRLSTDGFDEVDRDQEWRQTLESNFADVSVDIVAELGRAQVTLGEVLQLEVGEILRLDQSPDDAVAVCVEGVRKLAGQPTVRHGNLAVILDRGPDPRRPRRRRPDRAIGTHPDSAPSHGFADATPTPSPELIREYAQDSRL